MTRPGEGFPVQNAPEQGPSPEAILMVQEQMAREGGEAAIRDRIGLGAEELSQRVKYLSFEGTLFEAIAKTLPDGSVNKCPVGDMLAAAYEEEGIQGVETELATMSRQARTHEDEHGNTVKNFDVKVSEKTRELSAGVNQQKKN
ncbi:hypothetical protein H7Y63_00805 [Polaromonas sp.]|nr:hypothetical protein [Candidatus Saccharibacteria bacterium]